MAKNQDRRKPKETPKAPDADLTRHLQALGLASVDDYPAWCERHGFRRSLSKDARSRERECAYAHRLRAERRLIDARAGRRPDQLIERIARGQASPRDLAAPEPLAIDRVLNRSACGRRTRDALLRLLKHVATRADLLRDHPVIDQYGRNAGNSYIGGLLALALESDDWIRPVEAWRPGSHNVHRQFSELARHLFATWPVPASLDSAWFLGDGPESRRRRRWFLHVGRGQNIRTAELPLPYTKRMAHEFAEAPDGLTADEALRWGQIRALGGDGRLVYDVLETRMGVDFFNNDFWTTVWAWFIAHPDVPSRQVGPIVDFLQSQRFEGNPPPQSHLTMKGRTHESLWRQVEAWHRTLDRTEQPEADWPASGFPGFEFVEGSEEGHTLKAWTIRELLHSRALAAEGRTMKHCVSWYARRCARGECSIWALEVETFEGEFKVLTIEVRNASRQIVQARGRCNAPAGPKSMSLLQRWASRAGLTVSSYL